MPLYEGIALIQEKQAVVLDIGAVYTKFGFTGEGAPRCIVRSEFLCPTTRQIRRLTDYTTPEELYDNLVELLHLLYFRHVLVNPKERKVVVVESLLTPTLFRETLAKVLFCHYEVASVAFAPSALMCSVALGSPPALLVIDAGWEETQVAGVVHGCVYTHALLAAPLGARALHDELARRLDLDNGAALHLPDRVLEDIKVKTCFVTTMERALQWETENPPAPAPEVRYPLPSGTICISGQTRELTAEILYPRDHEEAGLADTVLQCIMQCPIDARRPLAQSVVVAGGAACLPGYRARLAAELRRLAARAPRAPRRFAFHAAPCRENYTAWLGGALLGATEALGARALARDAYRRAPRLRDWPCLLDNTPPAHPHWSALGL